MVRPPVSNVTLGGGSGAKDGNSSDQDDDHVQSRGEMRSRELGLGITSTYYVLLFLGAYGWYRTLWLLTESRASLADFRR